MKVDIYQANNHKYKFLVLSAGSELGKSLGITDPNFSSVSVFRLSTDLNDTFPVKDPAAVENDIKVHGYHITEWHIDVSVEIQDMPR